MNPHLRRPIVDTGFDGEELGGDVERGRRNHGPPCLGREQHPQVVLAALGLSDHGQVVIEQEHGRTGEVEGRWRLERAELRSS